MSRIEIATLATIKRRFVESEGAVERAFGSSESFRSLCRDYLDCARALERWRASDSHEASGRSAEYEELLAELTREIEERLRVDGRD